MKIEVKPPHKEGEALLQFLSQVSFEAVAQALPPDEHKAFEKASETLRAVLRGHLERDAS